MITNIARVDDEVRSLQGVNGFWTKYAMSVRDDADG
jgi:hypothetical protein